MSRSSEQQTPNITVESAFEEQISFVLGHPRLSTWLKTALSDALHRDPISVLNELEILNLILRNRSAMLIAKKYNPDDPR